MKNNEYIEIADEIIKLLDGQTEFTCKFILQLVSEKLDSLSVLDANLAPTVLFPPQP
jgi:hypothetical protein